MFDLLTARDTGSDHVEVTLGSVPFGFDRRKQPA
jgi:hypothetical protein